MFEFEQCEPAIAARINHPTLDAKTQKESGPERIRSYSAMSWGEHCTECVFPTCYQTCSFYQPRQDGRCRRFTFGIYRAAGPRTWMGYSALVEFKNWSKLWTQGNATQLPGSFRTLLQVAEGVLWGLSGPLDRLLQKVTGRKWLSIGVQSLRRRVIRKVATLYHHFHKPDCLLIEVFNPMEIGEQLQLSAIGSKGGHRGRFEWTHAAPAGLSSFAIPVADLETQLDLGCDFELALSVAQEEGKRLYICSATFVRLRPRPALPIAIKKQAGPRKIKCVIWDLDNTLWDGVLLEIGPEAIKLKDGIRSILKELDRRGILLSIASKNSEEDVRKTLETLGIWAFFLAPRINWQPKSASIQQIAQELNLGLDAFAFVDDMPFERDEVAAALPSIALIPAEEYLSLLGRPDFAGDASTDGASRRLMYLTERKRHDAMASSSEGYAAFLATCGIEVTIQQPGDDLVPRIQDIVQRTNQLNISSQRYNVDETRALIHSKEHDCFIISCADNYGDYGYVGFISVARRNSDILLCDCMFSCRIQGKGIDEAVLAHIINHYLRNSTTGVRARFIPTKRNSPAGEMLGRLGFVPEAGHGGHLTLDEPTLRQEVGHVQIHSDLA